MNTNKRSKLSLEVLLSFPPFYECLSFSDWYHLIHTSIFLQREGISLWTSSSIVSLWVNHRFFEDQIFPLPRLLRSSFSSSCSHHSSRQFLHQVCILSSRHWYLHPNALTTKWSSSWSTLCHVYRQIIEMKVCLPSFYEKIETKLEQEKEWKNLAPWKRSTFLYQFLTTTFWED